METYPMLFDVVMLSYGVKINLTDCETYTPTSDFEVELVFDDKEGDVNKYIGDNPAYISEGICDIHSGLGSPFFFDDCIVTENPNEIKRALGKFATLRDAYLYALKFEGVKSITFTTENPKYKFFVDELNNMAVEWHE